MDPLSSDYTHSLQLLDEGRFHIFWKYDDTTITFEIHAKTLGWVGFGLSPNGGMTGSDVIVAWVKDGQTHFTVIIIYICTYLFRALCRFHLDSLKH